VFVIEEHFMTTIPKEASGDAVWGIILGAVALFIVVAIVRVALENSGYYALLAVALAVMAWIYTRLKKEKQQ
jgi:hypothetical protein